MEYNFRDIEKSWQKHWKQNHTFKVDNTSSKPKYYVLDMFPYPSGAGLHVGHPLGFIASDIVSRYKRLSGFHVLHPMGFDAFGLPAEQYAIETGQHPATTTEKNIARYREQLEQIGFCYDWDREVRTCDPEYYKWTQWVFIQLFDSWYNCRNKKAEPISTLIAVFETEGFRGEEHAQLTGNIEQDVQPFTAAEWKGFDEKTQRAILMNFRLAYLDEAWVNWCPALGTVLANDEVKDGVSERGGYPVERKRMPQWSLRITSYADRLLRDLDGIDWSESIKEAQRNWIGRSEGSSIIFKIEGHDESIEVFTTRPDTVFGVSFVTLAPEHALVEKITTGNCRAAVDAYVVKSKNRSERERQADVKNISGEFTGAYVLHPFTGKQIPVWVGDYVLAGYGTGAVMAVPAHDSRDHAFAKHFGLPIIQVIETPAGSPAIEEASYDEKSGKLINSGFLNNLDVKDAIKKAISEIETRGFGKGKVNFRLRDAAFGRQRYWGEPIPVYYKDGAPYTLHENELPLVLPEIEKFLPTETGEPPLARASATWKYQDKYEYEHTTMPGWAGSSWYFLRYMDPKNENRFVSEDAANYWQNVDLYLGGAEHATGHLLYVRFWTKFLCDRGWIPVQEPAKKLINQGMIGGTSMIVSVRVLNVTSVEDHKEDESQYYMRPASMQAGANDKILERHFPVDFVKFENGEYFIDAEVLQKTHERHPAFRHFMFEEGVDRVVAKTAIEKMSKRYYNVVNPDDICEQYGADTLRLYEMFLGPIDQAKPWNTNGISGVHNFLRRFWRLFRDEKGNVSVVDEAATKDELKVLHRTIKKVTDDIERFAFNTCVSSFMIACNELTDLKSRKKAVLEPLVVLLSPFAPHIAEEIWHNVLGHHDSVSDQNWPQAAAEYLADDAVEYPVQVNGKVRFKFSAAVGLSPQQIEKEVLAHEEMQKWLEGKAPKKVIVVPNRIVNIVL